MTTITQHDMTTSDLTLTRRNLMRVGYLIMGLGLAVFRWPLLLEIRSMPLYEGVTLCLLTAMSLLAILGLRYPVEMLPILLFESAWKLLWLGLVALPTAMSGSLDPAATEVAVNCSIVVVILAVTPWRFVWERDLRTIWSH